jgi:hypothetical protein
MNEMSEDQRKSAAGIGMLLLPLFSLSEEELWANSSCSAEDMGEVMVIKKKERKYITLLVFLERLVLQGT